MPWWLYNTVVFLGTNKLFFHHLEPLLIDLLNKCSWLIPVCNVWKRLLIECMTMIPNKASPFYHCCTVTNFVAVFPLLEFISFYRHFNRWLGLKPWNYLIIVMLLSWGGFSQKNWMGVFSQLLKALTLFKTKICDFPYSIWLDQKLNTLFKTWPLDKCHVSRQLLWRAFVDGLIKNDKVASCKKTYPVQDWSAKPIPYLAEIAKANTLFLTKTAKKSLDTLWDWAYLYSPYKGMPSPLAFWCLALNWNLCNLHSDDAFLHPGVWIGSSKYNAVG